MAIERATDPVVRLEQELLARLGLGPDASADDVAAAHAAIVAYLAAAPAHARGWARAQAAAADEAVALLSDPVALARRAGTSRAQAVDRLAVTTSPPPSRARARAAAPSQPTKSQAGASDDLLDELIAEVTPSAHRDEVRAAAPRPPRTEVPRRFLTRRMLGIAAALAAMAIIVFVVSGFADSSIPAAPGPAESQEAGTLDEAAVADLMARIQEDPEDADALMSLGDAFFAAGQFDVSAEWLGRLVALEPENSRALLALGAAQYNSGNAEDAEASWIRVIELEPDNVEAHYDLGALYFRQDPPDLEGMQREWQKVVELAPGTDIASGVQVHLDGLASAEPSTGPSETAP